MFVTYALEQIKSQDGPFSARLLGKTGPDVQVPFGGSLHKHEYAGENVQLQTRNCLYLPFATNAATFDAFAISDQVITLYQATIAERHPISVAGLDKLWDAVYRQLKVEQTTYFIHVARRLYRAC